MLLGRFNRRRALFHLMLYDRARITEATSAKERRQIISALLPSFMPDDAAGGPTRRDHRGGGDDGNYTSYVRAESPVEAQAGNKLGFDRYDIMASYGGGASSYYGVLETFGVTDDSSDSSDSNASSDGDGEPTLRSA